MYVELDADILDAIVHRPQRVCVCVCVGHVPGLPRTHAPSFLSSPSPLQHRCCAIESTHTSPRPRMAL